MKRCNDDTDDRGLCMLSEPMQMFCGLVDNIASGYDMILPAEIADELLSLPLFDIVTVPTVDDDLPVDFDLDLDNDASTVNECVLDVDRVNEASVNASVTDTDDHDTSSSNALIVVMH